MKRLLLFALCLPALAWIAGMTATPATAQSQTPAATDRLSAKDLRGLLTNLGYEEIKDLSTTEGKEKFEVKLSTSGFSVPVALEISPSRRFVWLTVSLGAFNAKQSAEALLRKNADIQPTQFYITKSGNLGLAIAAENRALNSAALKFMLDKIVQDVSDTSSVWNIK